MNNIYHYKMYFFITQTINQSLKNIDKIMPTQNSLKMKVHKLRDDSMIIYLMMSNVIH